MRDVDNPTVPDIIPDMPDDDLIQEIRPSEKSSGAPKEKRTDLRGGTGAAGPLIQMPAAGEEEEAGA